MGNELSHKEYKKKSKAWLLFLAVLLLVLFVLSFYVGKYPVSPSELLQVLFRKIFGLPQTWSDQVDAVVFRIRLPRLLAAVLVGGALSAAGAAYQGMFRNPMVSPDMLGASSGAGFGAALGLMLSLGYLNVSLLAFIFGVTAVLVAYLISIRVQQNQSLGMVLAGIMMSSLFSAATSFIKLIADPDNVLPAITYWLMGSLAGIRMQDVQFVFFPIAIGLIVLFAMRWQLNLVTMGEEEAKSMGVNTGRVRALVVGAATLVTAASVSVSGMIGWVGLVIPHLSRMLVGPDYRYLMPASMLMGASFLMVVDNISRSIATSEVPLGILTAFVGAPFFLYLILRKGRQV